jgi:hypothetical protein
MVWIEESLADANIHILTIYPYTLIPLYPYTLYSLKGDGNILDDLMVWIEESLADAKKSGLKVYIVGHQVTTYSVCVYVCVL